MRTVHPIEARSYRILREVADTSRLPARSRDVVERVIHTTADPSWLDDLVTDETALDAGALALAAGAPLVVDAAMVAAGITAYPSECLVAEGETRDLAEAAGLTRSAAAIRRSAARHPDGAVWAVGNAPTALAELVRLA
jgi:precorrin-8X/cobalt-precorrin-8 methylmutase